jgi:hypothetical protein
MTNSYLDEMVVARGETSGGNYYGSGLGERATTAIASALDGTPLKPLVDLHRTIGNYAFSLGAGFVGVLMVLVTMYIVLKIILPNVFRKKSKFSNDTYQNRYRGAIRTDNYGEEDRWGIPGRNVPRYSGFEGMDGDEGMEDEGMEDEGMEDEGMEDEGMEDEGMEDGEAFEGMTPGTEYFDVDGVRKNAFSNARESPYFSDVSDYVSTGQKRQQAAVNVLAGINRERRRLRMISQGKDPERDLPWGPFWSQYQKANPMADGFNGGAEGMEEKPFSVGTPY